VCPIGVGATSQQGAQAQFQVECSQSTYYKDLATASSWSSSNTAVFTLNNTAPVGLLKAVGGGTATASSQGQSECSSWYELGGSCECGSWVPASGSAACAVQVPAYVGVKSAQAGSQPCAGGGTGRYLQVYYQVLDSSKTPIKQQGKSVAEELSWASSTCSTSNACGQKPSPATWTTDSTGTITQPETIINCSSTCTHGGSCTENWQQTFTVGGKSVGIVNSSVTGTLNCVATSCTYTPQATTH